MRTATLFAIAGMILWTIRVLLLVFRDISGVAGGFVPMGTLLVSIIELVVSLSLLIFFIVYRRSHT